MEHVSVMESDTGVVDGREGSSEESGRNYHVSAARSSSPEGKWDCVASMRCLCVGVLFVTWIEMMRLDLYRSRCSCKTSLYREGVGPIKLGCVGMWVTLDWTRCIFGRGFNLPKL